MRNTSTGLSAAYSGAIDNTVELGPKAKGK